MIKVNKDLKNTSRPFELGELFFSTTDTKGIITAYNDVFLRVAGYSSEQLQGKPHNCIRHPHMPRCVFKILWDYLLAGKTIGAYVKNLAANGEYYWVYALACPIPGGFLSIRFKPSSKVFDTVQSLYQELLATEDSYGIENWRDGMAASYKKALSSLEGLGFSTYDSFMFETLRLEMENFCSAVEGNSHSGTGAKLKGLTTLREDLEGKSKGLRSFVEQLHQLAVNASVRARHMGQQGKALGVIGEEISRVSRSIKLEISEFSGQVETLSKAIQSASFDISMASLQGRMAKNFTDSVKNEGLSVDEQVRRFGKPADELSQILAACELKSVTQARDNLSKLTTTMYSFGEFIGFLNRIIQTLQFAYVTGQAEAASIRDDRGFSSLLVGLSNSSSEVREELSKLRESIDTVGAAVQAAV